MFVECNVDWSLVGVQCSTWMVLGSTVTVPPPPGEMMVLMIPESERSFSSELFMARVGRTTSWLEMARISGRL